MKLLLLFLALLCLISILVLGLCACFVPKLLIVLQCWDLNQCKANLVNTNVAVLHAWKKLLSYSCLAGFFIIFNW